MNHGTIVALLEAQDRQWDGEERRREERDADCQEQMIQHLSLMMERVIGVVATRPEEAVAAAAPMRSPVIGAPKMKPRKMTLEDDPEAFLVTFKRMAIGRHGYGLLLKGRKNLLCWFTTSYPLQSFKKTC
ncbi:UNVERIFIED_CONTAM: hypothetical protein FKN15_018121 [Acipenser sinensis]